MIGAEQLAAEEALVDKERAQQELNEDLRLFATLGDIEALRLRLLRGADVDDVDDEGNTALLVAVKKDRVEVALELLKNGADFRVRNRFNQTAMAVAVRGGFVGCVKALVAHGCPTREPEGGFSALFDASRLVSSCVVGGGAARGSALRSRAWERTAARQMRVAHVHVQSQLRRAKLRWWRCCCRPAE